MKENVYKNNIFAIFSFIFLALMAGNYMLNRSFVREILVREQLSILKSSSERIEKWLENKKSSLRAVNELISKYDSAKDEQIITDILDKSQEIANFSSVYAGYENNITVSSRLFDRPQNYSPVLRPWYINTVKEDKIYITKPYSDVGLKVPVISICSSIKQDEVLKGVLCGVISFSDIKTEILDLRIENGYLFLIDESLNVLLHPIESVELSKIKFNIENLDLNKTQGYEMDDAIFTFRPLEGSKLVLVAKTLKKNIYNKINEQFIVNLTIYTVSIFLFLILAYFYNKRLERQSRLLEQTKREYEILLFQQTKMAELGQMIAALSHQWIQPLNSLGIFLGNLVQFKKTGKLSDEIFYDNINRSLANIDYMSKTMDTFKNFYKIESRVQNFNICDAIRDTICVLFPSKRTVDIKVSVARGVSPLCENYANEFKQIIACLIQNSKQALQNAKNQKRGRIVVNIKRDATHFLIRVIDNADGIDVQRDKIFTPFCSTKGSSGLGLYVSKLIANKKCGGDLSVVNFKNPTIFMLKIAVKVENDK